MAPNRQSNANYDAKLQVYLTEERIEEIDEAIENGDWRSRSDYLRHVIRAGESNIAELDPRTDEHRDNQQDQQPKERFVTDGELVEELKRLTSMEGGDFVDVNEAMETFVKELESDITDRLFQMSQDPGSPVETDKKGGYRVQ